MEQNEKMDNKTNEERFEEKEEKNLENGIVTTKTEAIDKIDDNNKLLNNEKLNQNNEKKLIKEKENLEKLNDNKENNPLKEKIEEKNINEEIEEEEEEDKKSSYIFKYTRKTNEKRESLYDKELIKPKHCFYMIELKIIKGKTEKYLLIYCHEIAAIYFDEIYEKKYSIKDLCEENKHFRIFEDVDKAKIIIDELINNNNISNNPNKIFLDVLENTFRLHLKITFFDKEKEIILNIPKKNIDDKERIRLLPKFLEEIQIKMNRFEEENKKLKNGNNRNGKKFLDNGNKEFVMEEKM